MDYSDVTEDVQSNGDVPDGTAQVLAADPGSATSVLSVSHIYEPLVRRTHADESATPGILPAGILVLREAHRRLGVTLEVARGGVREGAILGLLDELAEAAA